MIMTTKDWCAGMTPMQIIDEMETRKTQILFEVNKGNIDKADDLYGMFLDMLTVAKSSASDMASEFYMYRNHNNVYDMWRKCILKLDIMKHKIDSGIHEYFRAK